MKILTTYGIYRMVLSLIKSRFFFTAFHGSLINTIF